MFGYLISSIVIGKTVCWVMKKYGSPPTGAALSLLVTRLGMSSLVTQLGLSYAEYQDRRVGGVIITGADWCPLVGDAGMASPGNSPTAWMEAYIEDFLKCASRMPYSNQAPVLDMQLNKYRCDKPSLN